MVCFIGNTGVGKTTVAKYLSATQGFTVLGLRDPLVMPRSDVLGYSEIAFKHLFGQRVLYEMLNATLWSRCDCDSVVIDDLCTDEEALYFKFEYKATIIHITRPGIPSFKNENVLYADYVLENRGTIEDLLLKFDAIYFPYS
jgi:MoxR-like ATPase